MKKNPFALKIGFVFLLIDLAFWIFYSLNCLSVDPNCMLFPQLLMIFYFPVSFVVLASGLWFTPLGLPLLIIVGGLQHVFFGDLLGIVIAPRSHTKPKAF